MKSHGSPASILHQVLDNYLCPDSVMYIQAIYNTMLHNYIERPIYASCNEVEFKSFGTAIYSIDYNGTVIDTRCLFIDLGNGEMFIGAMFELFAFQNVDQQQCTFNNLVGGNDGCVANQYDLEYVESNLTYETYRWSYDRIQNYKQMLPDSPYLLTTCNGATNLDSDHILMEFDNTLFTSNIQGAKCINTKSVSIYGYGCEDTSVNIWMDNGTHAPANSFHVDPSRCNCDNCGCSWVNGSEQNVDVFGYYGVSNSDHQCSMNSDSTTNYYIGSIS